MSINRVFKQITLVSLLVASTAMAQTPYDDGQKALREQRWMDAAEQFELAMETDKKQADAAMYWRAHALYKAGRKSEASRQARNLERNYPDSRWVKEAQALQIEHQDSIDSSGLDDDMRIYALSQLMERDPERALPLVLNTMKSTSSRSVRNDALFVLGMSEDPAAQKALAEIARDSADPGLQANAIHMLGAASTESSLALLAGLYTESADQAVREAVIHAYIASDDAAPLIKILKTEKDPQLQRDIIHSLGAMDATEELQAIYPTLESRENKIAAIEAFAISDNSAMLKQVIDGETDPELRKSAIEGIAIIGDQDAVQFLESIYDGSTTREEKLMVLEALVILDDVEPLALRIVRSEKDPELQQLAIQVLGVIGATDELGALYSSFTDSKTRRMVLESMAIAGDTDGLRQVLESETDPELRTGAIHAFAIADDDSTASYLVSQYARASHKEKTAIIESMMIMDEVEGLIGLLKQETDPELKREMLQMLTVMDSEASDEYLFELLENKG